MRPQRLLTPLALLIPLAAAAPASGADVPVNVIDFEFVPGTLQVQPGDSVNWTFTNGGHTTTAERGQAASWNSGPETNEAGTSFSHTFQKPGRFQYVCIPHEGFMKGVVQVGTDPFKTSFKGAVKAKGLKRSVRFSATLNEAARVTWSLKGAAKKKVTKKLRAGRVSQVLKKLKAGSYSATVTAVDDFDKKSVKRVRFTVKG